MKLTAKARRNVVKRTLEPTYKLRAEILDDLRSHFTKPDDIGVRILRAGTNMGIFLYPEGLVRTSIEAQDDLKLFYEGLSKLRRGDESMAFHVLNDSVTDDGFLTIRDLSGQDNIWQLVVDIASREYANRSPVKPIPRPNVGPGVPDYSYRKTINATRFIADEENHFPRYSTY